MKINSIDNYKQVWTGINVGIIKYRVYPDKFTLKQVVFKSFEKDITECNCKMKAPEAINSCSDKKWPSMMGYVWTCIAIQINLDGGKCAQRFHFSNSINRKWLLRNEYII